MSTWVAAGSTTDLTEPLSTTLMNFVSGHWAETNPAVTDVRFLQDWYDGYGAYQIHFRESDTPVAVQTLGWRYRAYDEYVMLHVFVKRNMAQEPPERANMLRELQRIISQNKDKLPLGGVTKNSQMQIVQINDEILSNAVANVWHSIMRIRIHYWKVDIS